MMARLEALSVGRWWRGWVGTAPARGRGWWRVRVGVMAAVWAYAAGVVVVVGLVRFLGDRWWGVTPLLYGPLWVIAVPLVVLVPAVVVVRSWRMGGVLGVCAVLVAYGMGLRVHWPRSGIAPRDEMTVLTCNVDGKLSTVEGLFEIMSQRKVDVVALQECGPTFPIEVMKEQGWEVRAAGDLMLASRYPVKGMEVMPYPVLWRHPVMRVDLETPRGEVHVFVVHLDTPRSDLEAFVHPTRQTPGWMKEGLAARRGTAELAGKEVASVAGTRLVVGDFNLVEHSGIFRDCFGDYTDAFAATGLGLGHTKKQSRWGVRIDHLLCDGGLRPTSCEVMPDVGSDHLPVVATFAFTGVGAGGAGKSGG